MKHRENNMILLKIYFGKMSYQKLEEKVAYSVFDMIGLLDPTSDTNFCLSYLDSVFPQLTASLGGTLGLCIGASLLTICELIEHGVLALVHGVHRYKQKRSKANVIAVTPFFKANSPEGLWSIEQMRGELWGHVWYYICTNIRGLKTLIDKPLTSKCCYLFHYLLRRLGYNIYYPLLHCLLSLMKLNDGKKYFQFYKVPGLVR